MQIAQTKYQSPISSYHKYRSQYKTNALLNRLNNDLGYPQDIFTINVSSQNKNYLSMNKKNLKNFYSDRIQKQDPNKGIFKQSQTIDPSRIFQIRKQQYQLKHKTKMYLNSTMHVDPNKSKQNKIRKVSQIFAINDKNKQFIQAFGDSRSKSHSFYDPLNYRRGTTSFVQKKSSLTKKQAYQKVFGPDISSISKSQACQRKKPQTNNQYKTIELKKVHDHTSKNKAKQFKKLITKMKNHYQQFNTNGTTKLNNLDIKEQNQLSQRREANSNRQVITCIQKFSKTCAANLQNFDRIKLRQLRDIHKIDSEFFEKMSQHKKKRLQTRLLYLDNSVLNNNYNKIVNNQKDQLDQMSQYSVTDVDNLQDMQKNRMMDIMGSISIKSKSMRERFVWFGKKLNVYLLKMKMFGITKNNIYDAFWSKSQPYQKQGSYAFFKAIKIGNPNQVQVFLNRSQKYLFEKDQKGRSPLMVAVKHEHINIVKRILDIGVNVDYECYNKKRALHIAIQTKNYLLVKLLLQHGAQPWSTLSYKYHQKQHQKNSIEILNLMKNARKLRLGLQLYEFKHKQSFWNKNKQNINENEQIVLKPVG